MDSNKDSSDPVTLPPLNIPDGISEEDLSKLIIDVLLRKALITSDPLSKWVLLGTLEILQERTPRLTPSMLANLHNAQQRQGSVDKGIQCERWKKTNKN